MSQAHHTRSLPVSQPIPPQWCHRSIILDHCLYHSQYHHSDVTGASYSARQWGEDTQMQATRSLPVSQPIPSQWCHRSIILDHCLYHSQYHHSDVTGASYSARQCGEDTQMQATRSLPVSQPIPPQWCHRSIILSQTVWGGHTDASN